MRKQFTIHGNIKLTSIPMTDKYGKSLENYLRKAGVGQYLVTIDDAEILFVSKVIEDKPKEQEIEDVRPRSKTKQVAGKPTGAEAAGKPFAGPVRETVHRAGKGKPTATGERRKR